MRSLALVVLMMATPCAALAAPSFVEYLSHPAIYGDHTINAVWTGGPVPTVLVEFQSDETILHADGMGQSQRTARNTLTFTPPSAAANPQDFDNLAVTGRYGGRLPLLQQLSANGTSVLSYQFPTAVAAGFDLFVTDVDTSDSARIRAFGPGNAAIDMTTWRPIIAGDLSLYKNTGAGFSSIVAPSPTTVITPDAIDVTAVNPTNYNRSYSIFRAPAGALVERVDIAFTGVQNSPSRELGGNGSHLYHALATLSDDANINGDDIVDEADLAVWQTAPFGSSLADADGDFDSDGVDFLVWQRQFGSIAARPGAHDVPEPETLPTSLAVGMSVSMSASAVRRRRRWLRQRRRG